MNTINFGKPILKQVGINKQKTHLRFVHFLLLEDGVLREKEGIKSELGLHCSSWIHLPTQLHTQDTYISMCSSNIC